MDCGWRTYYTINNTAYLSTPTKDIGCDKNKIISVKIAPHSTEFRILDFEIKKAIPAPEGLELKVGFNFVPVVDGEVVSIKDWLSPQKINYVWSNSLKVY